MYLYLFLLSSRVCLGLLSAQGININPQLLYERHLSINQYQLLFWLHANLRSRSTVDLGEFFNKQSCIDPVDLRLVCKYCHGLYFGLYGCIDPVDLHCEL